MDTFSKTLATRRGFLGLAGAASASHAIPKAAPRRQSAGPGAARTAIRPSNTTAQAEDGYVPHFVDPSSGTGDDAAWLNAYLASLPQGVTVFFPATTYQVASASIVLPNGNRYYGYGSGQGGGQTIFQRQPNATLSPGGAVICDAAWQTSSAGPSAGEPVYIEGLTINGNQASDSATVGHGLVVMTYGSKLIRNNIENTPQSGIVLADQSASGNALSGTAQENRLVENTVFDTGSYGIWIQDHGTGALTDGYMTDNIVDTPGSQAIRNEQAAGWFYRGNHAYNCPVDCYYFENVYGTQIIGNEADQFGKQGTASTTYTAYNFSSILGTDTGGSGSHPLTCIGNQSWAAESLGQSSTVYNYYAFTVAPGFQSAFVAFVGNGAHAENQFTQPGSCAVVYTPNGSTLVVQDVANLIDGPAPFQVQSGGTLVHGGGSTVLSKAPVVTPSATANTYGTPATYGSNGVPLLINGFFLASGGTFHSETLTAELVATFSDGSTQTFTHKFTSVTTYQATQSDISTCFKDGLKLVSIAVSAASTIANSATTCTFSITGWYGG
jgi:hypothetical protein